ncbi:MAG: hypothetical protein IJJ89_05670, partial [Eubacterium sp.]|nr:hypothetical protein [Eubacterium sp.]
LVIAILVLSFMWNWTLILIGILIGPAAIILTVSMFAMPIFRRIERQNTEDGLETYSDRDEE